MDERGSVNYFTPEACFDDFCISSSLGDILLKFDKLCDILQVPVLPGDRLFYRTIRQKLSRYWKAESLFHKLDCKFNDEQYASQEACNGLQTLVVGCGPCGLRCAIELAVLGARVIVVEKRTSFSRHNILHLWPFLIHDLKSLGAKTFFGKFCAGSIDHISIRTLQCILLKVALLFGVQVITGVTFTRLVEPSDSEGTVNGYGDGLPDLSETRSSRPLFTFYDGKRARYGWRAEFKPFHRSLSSFEFDVLIGAAGKSNSCLEFPRKELRCRLAIAVTANFVNYNTADEARVEEISGVASIFNQQYFSLISKTLGIELENLVYYKDETHYFVMTAKKHSLLSKGVLKKDLEDPSKLLHPDNVDLAALQQLSRDVATFATHGGLSRLDFAVNAYDQPDVAIFDFTSLSAAEYACRIVDRLGRPLFQCLVGDALVEPFWPTGSGCALGFLSALDAAWAASLFAAGHHPLKVVAWRDSVYQRLSQTSPSNMPQNFASHALSPNTRYTCCDLELVRPMQVRHLYDNSTTAQMTERSAFSFLRDSLKSSPHLPPASVCIPYSPTSNGARSPCLPTIPTDVSLLKWFQISLSPYISANLCPPIPDLSVTSWRCGRALLCLLHKYTFGVVSLGKLQVIIPEFETDEGVSSQLQEASSLLSEHFSLPLPSDLLVSSPADNCSHLENQSDPAAWPAYLLALCLRLRTLSPSDDYASLFVCKSETTATANSTTPTPIRRPHLSQFNPSRSFDPLSLPRSPHRNRPFNPSVVGSQSTTEVQRLAERLIKRPSSTSADITVSGSAVFRKDPGYRVEKGIISKRRSELISMLNDPASAKRRSMLLEYQSLGCDTASSPLHLRRSASSTHGSQEALNMGLVGSESRSSSAVRKLLINSEPRKSTEFCVVCKKRLYAAEYRAFEGYRVHPSCFRCAQCQRALRPEIAHCYRPSSQPGQDPVFYCTAHFKRQQLENMEFTKCPSKLKPPPSPSVAPLNCASAPVKRRAHNTPSLFYDLVPKPPDLKTPSDFQPTRVSPHQKTRQPIPCDRNVSRISAGKKGHRRRAPMTSTSDQLLLNIPSGYPSLPRMRGIREPQGIRDEPSPPLSICSLPMSDILGMPESARQAAFESRLCESLLGNCALSVPVDSSPPAAADLQDEAYLAATESSSESTDDVNNTSPCGDGHSPVRLERMLSVCRAMRADALYRRSHPLEESSSSSSSSPSPSEPISDADGDVVPRVGPLGISAPIYENARWTLDRSEKLSQKSAAASSSANLLAQKYGLLNPSHIPTTADSNLSTFCSSNSLLAAKERFCMEAPKPVSIDPVAFLSNKNREASHITYLSDCSECVEPLPGLFSPTCLVSSWVDNDHLHSCLTFQQPSGQHVYPLTYYSSVISRLQNLHTTTLNFLFTTLHWTEKLRTLPPDTWHKANVHTVATPTSPHLYLTEPPLVQQINAAGAFLPLATPGEDIRDIDSHSIMTASPEKVDDYENSLSSSVASSKNISHDEERVEFWPPEVVDQPNTDRETLTVGADSSHRRILAPPLELSELRSEVEQLDYLTRSQTAPEFMKTARKGIVSGGEQSYSMPSRNGISDSSRGKKASDESGIAISNRPVPLFIYTTRFYSDSDTEDLFPCRTEEEDGTDASNATTTSYSDSDSATSTSRLPVAAAVPEAPIVPVNRMCASCSPPLGLHFPSVDINSVPASDMRKQKIEQLKRHLEQLTAQMKALEDKSTTTERELRRVESSAKPNVVDAKNASVALSSSEPDIACLAAKSVTLPKCKHRELPPSLAKRAKFPLRRSRRPLHEEGRSVQAGRPDTLPRACMAFTDCAGTVGPSEMQEVRTCDPVEESYLQIKHSRLFSELLNIIAQRNNLVTQEAELVSQVKQLELELYQDALETAYRTLHSSSPPPPPSAMSSSSSRPPVGNSLRKESRWRVPFRRTHKPTADPVAHKHCQRRAVSLEVGAREISADQCALLPRRQESQQSESLEGQLLLSEIWRVINERTTRSVVRDKTMQCASLQEMSVRRLLSRHKGDFQNAFSPASRYQSVAGGGCLGR